MHLCSFYCDYNNQIWMNPNEERNYLIRDKMGRNRIVDDVDAAMVDECECISFKPKKIHQLVKQGDGPLFVDEEFPISPQDIERLQMELGQQIVLKRLCRLFPKQHRPPLFPELPSKPSISRKQSLPPFIYQILMLGPSLFKGIILNSSFSENGRYEIVTNMDGKYELEVIDDVIPIFEDSQQPVWGNYLKETWQLIVVKLWAKIKGGYCRLKDTPPFEFIEHFTQTNWKYIRLSTEGSSFMAHYMGKVGQKCKIFLKSKASSKIEDSGLIPDRVAFELIGLQPTSNGSYVFIIRTVFENAWTGKSSIIDKSLKLTARIKGEYRLNYTLTLSFEDFINIFSTAYITHANLPLPIYHSFYEFSNPEKFSSARYFQINFAKEGFFNFIIQQPESNMVKVTSNKSLKLSQSGKNVEMRFLSLKYLLSRKVHAQSSKIYLQKQGQIGDIGELIRDSTTKFQSKYKDIEYDLYETAHRNGLTKSNAHFMKVIPGTYILRVKAETVHFQSDFAIHYSTHQLTEMEEVFMTKEESINFLNHNIISISDQVAEQQNSKPNYQKLTISDRTDTLGYGFAVLKLDKKCPYRAIIEVDPERLLKQGYILKNTYKKEKKRFKVQVGRGESKAIIFKRVSDRTSYSEPHKAFQVTKIKD